MASMGMMGALGGLGSSLVNEAGIMQKTEEADADMARKTKFEQWLMQAREEYTVKAEGRAEARTIASEGRATERDIAKDDRTWANEQTRAPAKRDMKVADETASAAGKLNFETGNIDAIAGNTQRKTDASRTEAQKAEDTAKARYWTANANDLEANGKGGGGKSDKSGTRLEPDDEMEYKSLEGQIKDLQSNINKARSDGQWDPEKNPGHKGLMTDMKIAQERQRAILAPYRDANAADPAGIRKGKGTPGATGMAGIPIMGKTDDGKDYTMKSPRSAEPIPNEPEATISPESGTITQAQIDAIRDPQGRANVRLANVNNKAPMMGAGQSPKSMPAATEQPGARSPDRTNPLEVMREATARPEVDPQPTSEENVALRSAEGEQRDAFLKGADMKPYEEKVKSLRERIQARLKSEREARMRRAALSQ